MAIWGTLGSIGGGALGSIFGGPAGAHAGSSIGGALGGSFDKVEGIPTPPDGSIGSTSGDNYRKYMDSAFPGTTAWERLGANSPAGATGSADIASKTSSNLQRNELSNRSSIAERTNRASLISSAISAGSPMGVQAAHSLANTALDAYSGYRPQAAGSGYDYDSHTRQGRDRLPSETRRNNAGSSLDEAKRGEAQTRSDNAQDVIDSDITSTPTRFVGTGVRSSLRILGKGIGSASKWASTKASKYLSSVNRGRLPARFAHSA